MPISRLELLYATVVLYEKSHLKWKKLAIIERPVDTEVRNVNCMQLCFQVRRHIRMIPVDAYISSSRRPARGMRIVSVDEHETFHYSAGHAEISGQIRLFERPREVRFTLRCVALRCRAAPCVMLRHLRRNTPQYDTIRDAILTCALKLT